MSAPTRQVTHYDQHLRQFAMEHDPLTIRLAQMNGEISLEEAVNRLEYTNREGLVAAGKMAVQIAANAPDFETASGWIQRAGDTFERASEIPIGGSHGADHAEARLGLAQLPLMGYLAMFHSLPPKKLVEKAYESTVEVISKVVHDWQNHRYDKDSDQKNTVLGTASETAVLLLGQRYALTSSIEESSWLPLHSLYSEDHANKTRRAYNRAWDVTFYTDLGESPEKSYFVQIKTSDYIQRDRRHLKKSAAHITHIYFTPDLAFNNEKGIPTLNAIDELAAECDGDSYAKYNLQARTEKLLDLLDRETPR